MLTGARGNMFLSPDGPEWLADLLRAGRVLTALREARAWSRVSGESLYRVLRGHALRPLLPARARRLVRIARGRPDPLSSWFASSALRPELATNLDLTRLRPTLDERHRTPFRQYTVTTVLTVAGQAEGAAALAALTGAEERDPTVDRRLIEVALRQPEWARRRDGITRAVIRGAMADRLPPEIVNRTRLGEQLPDWLDVITAARPELACELDALEQHPTSRQIVDTARLRGLMERWPDRTAGAEPAVARNYRQVLLRTLLVSRYLRWFERRASTVAASRSAAGQ
jgi:asparagine synthase (glutamine-hydrolysing)